MFGGGVPGLLLTISPRPPYQSFIVAPSNDSKDDAEESTKPESKLDVCGISAVIRAPSFIGVGTISCGDRNVEHFDTSRSFDGF